MTVIAGILELERLLRNAARLRGWFLAVTALW